MMFNPASPDRTCWLFNLADLKELVSENDLEMVFNKLGEINWELDEINTGIDKTIEIFKRLISDLIKAKYKNLSTIHSSSNHESMLLTKIDAFDFDQDIKEMMSACEMLNSMELKKKDAVLKVDDKKQDPSSFDSSKTPGLMINAVDETSSHSNKNLVSSMFEKSKSRISTRIMQLKVPGDNNVTAHSSNDNSSVPSLNLTSVQFVQDLANSNDQGVSVMREFYHKVLDLEVYSKQILMAFSTETVLTERVLWGLVACGIGTVLAARLVVLLFATSAGCIILLLFFLGSNVLLI
jgi:hypothetical protein